MLRPLALALAALPLLACQSTSRSGPAILATYERSGGFAGFDQRLVVKDSGALALNDRRENRLYETDLDPGTLDRLRALLSSPEFLAAKRSYAADGYDLITYVIDARTPQRTHTVTTMDTASHPPIVQQAIEELDRLAQLVRERGQPR